MKKRTLPAVLLTLALLAASSPARALMPDVVWRQGSAPPKLLLPGSMPFADLWGHWSSDSVAWCYGHGLIMGTDAGKFDPDAPMTRGVFLAALGRLEGIDPTLYRDTTPFPDVSKNDPYASYVVWAKQRGLVMGREDGAFDAHEPITRQELAALVDRYLHRAPPPYDGFEGYTDAHIISPWASESVESLRRMGVMGGTGDGTFGPYRTITRGECAALLRRVAAIRYPEV